MTGAGKLTNSEVERLEVGALALDSAMKLNLKDELEARTSNTQFIYFADAGIPIWYCRPQENQNLSGFEGVDISESKAVLPISVLTLDYIFSGALPGSGGLPMLLSPHHAEELASIVDKTFEQEMRCQGPEDKPGHSEEVESGGEIDEGRQELEAAIRRLRDVEAIPGLVSSTALASVFEAVADLLERPIISKTFFTERYAQLIDERYIVRADTYMELFADLGIADAWTNTSRDSRYRHWLELLHRTSTKKTKQSLSNDAHTLASIQYLNERATISGKNRQFLLITADGSIHAASAMWERDSPVLTGAFVRHPRQYAPLLNLNSAAKQMRTESVIFARLHQAIGDLVAGFGQHRPDVAYDEQPANLNGDDPRMVLASELRAEWASAMRTAALMLVDTFSTTTTMKTLNATIRTIEDQLTAPDITSLLSRRMEAETVGLLRRNLAFAIRGVLQSLVPARSAGSHASPVRHARMPTLFSIPFTNALRTFVEEHVDEPKEDVSAVLEWLVAEGSKPGSRLVDEFEQFLIDLPNVEAYALATAVAFRSQAWRLVQHFAKSCEASIRQRGTVSAPRVLLEEVRYCGRIAARFLLDSFEDFQVLREEWRRVYHDRPLAYHKTRAAAEMAAVELVFVFRDRFPPALNREKYTRQVFAESARWLDIASDLISRYRPGEPPGSPRQWRALEEQILVNRVAWHVLGTALFERGPESVSDEAPRRSLQRLNAFNLRGGAPPIISVLYQSSLELILADDAGRPAIRKKLRATIDAGLADGRLRGPLDRELAKMFRAIDGPSPIHRDS